MNPHTTLLCAALLGAYLIGGIPFGYLLVRLKTGQDVRAMGSGNIGATNVLRTTGKGYGILTLLLDIAKGAAAVLLMRWISGNAEAWCAAAAFAVLVGHAFPVFLKFKGGKAVASFVGAFLVLTPAALGLGALVFVLVVAVKRYVSLGSILGALAFPFLVFFLKEGGTPTLIATALGAALVIGRHHANISRLLAGTENVLQFGGKKK
jgi:glycerol-3-phosphate acyltransferase PlsY